MNNEEEKTTNPLFPDAPARPEPWRQDWCLPDKLAELLALHELDGYKPHEIWRDEKDGSFCVLFRHDDADQFVMASMNAAWLTVVFNTLASKSGLSPAQSAQEAARMISQVMTLAQIGDFIGPMGTVALEKGYEAVLEHLVERLPFVNRFIDNMTGGGDDLPLRPKSKMPH